LYRYVEAGLSEHVAAAARLPRQQQPHAGGSSSELSYRWVRPAWKPAAPKCIVYSGFKTHLDVIDLALTSAGVNFENIARMGMSRVGLTIRPTRDVALTPGCQIGYMETILAVIN
jgi:hypothetical protein